MSPEDRAYWVGKAPFQTSIDGGLPRASERQSRAQDAPKPGVALVSGGESSDGGRSRKDSKAAKATEKADAKRKKEEQESAAAALRKTEWNAMVTAQGGAL